MKNPILQLLLILALTAAAGTGYKLANPRSSQRHLPWDGSRIYGDLDTAVKPAVAEPPGVDPSAPPGSSASNQPSSTAGEFRMVDLKEALDELEHETPFIDARRTREYEAGHIPGAICICPYEQGDFLDKINKFRENAVLEAPVIVYCTNSNECESSKMLSRQLKDAGFLDIRIYLGGFPEWQKQKPDAIAKGSEPGKYSASREPGNETP